MNKGFLKRLSAGYILLGVCTSLLAGVLDQVEGLGFDVERQAVVAVNWPAHIWSVMERYTAAENAEADRQNRLPAPVDYIDI